MHANHSIAGLNGGGSILALEDLARVFTGPAGDVPVLKAVNLAVCAGDFVGLTGPSGSGKTTLLHLAGLLDRPTRGDILFQGRSMAGATERVRAGVRAALVGMVFQQGGLLPYRTGLENVAFRFRYLEVTPREARRQALEALDRLGLVHLADRPVRLMSGGERQRIAVARAVARPPALLLADEPTGNLDEASGEAVIGMLDQLHREGLTIILATHNTRWMSCCTRHWRCAGGTVTEGERAGP